MISLLRHLRLGWRLALFRTVHATAWRNSVGALLWLLLATVTLAITLDWLFLDPKPAAFNPLALRDAFWPLSLLLLLGWLAAGPFARARRAGDDTPGVDGSPVRHALRDAPVWPLMIPIAWLSVSLVVSLVVAASFALAPYLPIFTLGADQDEAVNLASYAHIALLVWQALIGILLFRRVARLSWFSSLLLTVPLAAMVFWTIAYPPARFWYVDATEMAQDDGPHESAVSEAVLVAQATMLEEHLNAIEPQRPGVIDLYFIAFAPYASQDVFRKELDVIVPLMEQRFDTAGHALRLVNSERTLKEYPFATVSNLRRAVQAIAEKIDRDEDIVMLYLSSHGSKNHLLAIDHPPLDLYTLDPAALKAMFDDAGIRNRVIVISACYSGGFAAPLRSESTLVMTAADADRKSFGCSDDSEFTYFGRAIFDEQLRRTRSFEQAFTDALPRLREREKQLNPQLPFSNPQLEIGSQIKARLKVFERQFESDQR
jgi:Peptidase C13 family